MPGIEPNTCIHLVAADSRAALALVGLDMIENLLFCNFAAVCSKKCKSYQYVCKPEKAMVSCTVGLSGSSTCMPAAKAVTLPEHCSADA